MPVYQLTDEVVFPPTDHAEPDGLLAVGGDLSAERLLLAYRLGIFPWYSEGQPILWWSPDPRIILEPKEFHISRRLSQTLKKGIFKVTFDRAFADWAREQAMRWGLISPSVRRVSGLEPSTLARPMLGPPTVVQYIFWPNRSRARPCGSAVVDKTSSTFVPSRFARRIS